MIEPRTGQCDLVIRSTKHELFFQGRCDQACPPEASQKHPHRLDPIMPTACIVAVTDTANRGAERHCCEPVAQISKLRRGT